MSTFHLNRLKTLPGVASEQQFDSYLWELAKKSYVDQAVETLMPFFNNVADMVASTSLYVGAFVQTLGYYSPGDGGGNYYEIVSAGTGTDDGGSFIDLSGSGFQAKALFLSNSVYAKQFGAIYDGSDDSSAHENGLSFALQNGLEYIFNSGDTYLDNQVSVTVSGSPPGVSTIRGMGTGASKVFVNNSVGGINIEFTDRNNQIDVRDFEVVAAIKGAGVGIQIKSPSGGNRHNRGVSFQNFRTSVVNDTDAVNYGYFDNSIDVSGTWRPYFDNVQVSGPFGPGISDDQSDTSPIYQSALGINFDGCYHPELHNSYVWSCELGVSSVYATDPGPEGIRISNTNFVEVKTALKFKRVGREPTVWFSDCHFNYRDRGLDINGAKFVQIYNCVPYNIDIDNVYAGTPYDIYFENVSESIIDNCIFHFEGNSSRINVRLSTDVTNTRVSNSIFNSTNDVAISIASGNSGILLVDNEYPGTYTTEVDDSSNSATIFQSEGPGRYRLESGSSNSSAGPTYSLYKNSDSPDNLDALGELYFDGNNSSASRKTYANLVAYARDVTSGAEEGALDVFTQTGGGATQVAEFRGQMGSTETSMFLLVNDGAVTSMRRVKVGDADSAGTGRRMLSVDN